MTDASIEVGGGKKLEGLLLRRARCRESEREVDRLSGKGATIQTGIFDYLGKRVRIQRGM